MELTVLVVPHLPKLDTSAIKLTHSSNQCQFSVAELEKVYCTQGPTACTFNMALMLQEYQAKKLQKLQEALQTREISTGLGWGTQHGWMYPLFVQHCIYHSWNRHSECGCPTTVPVAHIHWAGGESALRFSPSGYQTFKSIWMNFGETSDLLWSDQ